MNKRNRGPEAAMPMPVLPMPPKEEPILTREQVAEKLQVTPGFVDEIRRSRCANRLRFFKVGRYIRFRWSDVELYLAKQHKGSRN